MKLLFVPCSDQHVKLLSPVVEKLFRQSSNNILFISVDSLEKGNAESELKKSRSGEKYSGHKI